MATVSSTVATNRNACRPGKLTIVLVVLECIFIILFGVFVRYDPVGQPNTDYKTTLPISTATQRHSTSQQLLSTPSSPLSSTSSLLSSASPALSSASSPPTTLPPSLGSDTNVTTSSPELSALHADVHEVSEAMKAEGHGELSPGELEEKKKTHIPDYYAMFQDIHVMMFIGFGFLMTFLKRYGFGSVGFNFLLAAFILQWATLTHGFIREMTPHDTTIHVDVVTLINADFASAAVLISFGAVLGKVSMLQLIVMAMFEVLMYQVNELIVFDRLHATDTGDSLVVHIYGAYFGLAVSRVLYNSDIRKNEEKESSIYHSDMFAMIGTIFLWLFWPSFNAGTAVDEGRVRAVINTYFSLTASTIVTYAISKLVTKEKFSMVHVQNSTLAGGVAVGTVADLIIQPWGAMLVGSVAGTISVIGYRYLTPLLHKKLKVHDTCGVNNLHGMPGIISGIGGILAAGIATQELYGDGLTKIFAPGQTPGHQAGIQAAALFVSIAMALGCGTVTGFILRIPIWDQPSDDQIFDDEDFWLIEAGYPDTHEAEHHADTHTYNETSNQTNNSDNKRTVVTQFTTAA